MRNKILFKYWLNSLKSFLKIQIRGKFVFTNWTNFFKILSWYNRILIYDGPDANSMIIGELFGTPSNKFVKSISSSGKYMFIEFKKQKAGMVEFGASIEYKKIDSSCQFWMHSNVLMSPNYPTINCSWTITRKFGTYITLDFSYLEV